MVKNPLEDSCWFWATSRFTSMLSRWPTNPFGIVLSALTTIGTTLILTFQSFLNLLARSWYLSIFSVLQFFPSISWYSYLNNWIDACLPQLGQVYAPMNSFCIVIMSTFLFVIILSAPTLSIHKLCGLLIPPLLLGWQPVFQSLPFLHWFAMPGPGLLLTILLSS